MNVLSGHIGILVPSLEEACARFEQLGVTFVKRPTDGQLQPMLLMAIFSHDCRTTAPLGMVIKKKERKQAPLAYNSSKTLQGC